MHLSDYLCRVGFHVATKAKVSPVTIEATKDQIAIAIAKAAKNDWPQEEKTTHPIFCDRGRRSLLRGVQQARLWLSRMDVAQAKAELLHVIGATTAPIRFALPSSSQSKEGWHTYAMGGGWWNFGTINPSVIRTDSNPESIVSAWVPVLAWQSQTIVTEDAYRYWSRVEADSIRRLYLPAWDRPCNPVELITPSWSMRQTKSLYVWSLENRLSQQAAEFYPSAVHVRSADDAKRYGTVAEAATAAGVPRTTLVYAVDRGEVPSKKTFGGTILVAISDAKKWAKNRPKPGRKPQD